MARSKIQPLGHCSRCTRACWKGADDAARWKTKFDKGILVGLLCPESRHTRRTPRRT
ncbi:hypothetical protein ACIOC2_33165 [Streptomyces sp. NPDC088337]|uniref:hypothetical protein n=1 Tax=unclassified Streptomyces TaxID=2593676 RepID=UPI002DDC0663|nr:hypothetical protein [Streptomyces sp. NBC_01788]WSB30170.1 hypothetical protein OIE49_32205 [Streptomyces sp. NBC_01788]